MITATHVYKFCKCPRKVYMDRYGDRSRKRPWSEFMLHKMQQGKDYELEVVRGIPHEEIEYDNDVEGAEKTYRLLKGGVDELYQGVIMHEDLLGKPDLLERTEGGSYFGSYHYVPCDIKLGLHTKEEYVMQVMFYCHLLERVQETLPKKAFLILGDGKRVELKTDEHYARFLEYLYDIGEILEGKEADVFMTSVCKECPWYDSCMDTAKERKDLSLLYRMTRKVKETLRKGGIKDIEDAAKMDPSVAGVDLGKHSLQRLHLQSKAIIEDRPIKIMDAHFPKRPVEIYFDIEGETELDLEYLFGMLVVKDGKEEYIDFTAESPDDEKKAWNGFIDYFKPLKDDEFVVYHYHSYEKRALNKLRKKYGAHDATFDKLFRNMRDLFSDVIKTVYLPLYSYSIKPIARYIGFDWTSEDAGGAQSMLWYSTWLDTKDRKLLKKIKQYNKEDCIATLKVKEWLEKL